MITLLIHVNNLDHWWKEAVGLCAAFHIVCLQISKWQWLCLHRSEQEWFTLQVIFCFVLLPTVRLEGSSHCTNRYSSCRRRLLSALCSSEQMKQTEKTMNVLFIAGVYCRVEWKCPQFETQTNHFKIFTPMMELHSSPWAKGLSSIFEDADTVYVFICIYIYIGIICVIML